MKSIPLSRLNPFERRALKEALQDAVPDYSTLKMGWKYITVQTSSPEGTVGISRRSCGSTDWGRWLLIGLLCFALFAQVMAALTRKDAPAPSPCRCNTIPTATP